MYRTNHLNLGDVTWKILPGRMLCCSGANHSQPNACGIHVPRGSSCDDAQGASFTPAEWLRSPPIPGFPCCRFLGGSRMAIAINFSILIDSIEIMSLTIPALLSFYACLVPMHLHIRMYYRYIWCPHVSPVKIEGNPNISLRYP